MEAAMGKVLMLGWLGQSCPGTDIWLQNCATPDSSSLLLLLCSPALPDSSDSSCSRS